MYADNIADLVKHARRTIAALKRERDHYLAHGNALAFDLTTEIERVNCAIDRLTLAPRVTRPHTLVVTFDVEGFTDGQIAALAFEACARGEASNDHPEASAVVAVRP